MNNRLFKIILLLLILGAILYFFFDSLERTPGRSLPVTTFIADSVKTDTIKGAKLDGELLYNKNCGVCHQADGNGDGARFPSLKGSEWVKGDKGRLIGVVLNGLQGEIEVNGEKWNGVMPSFVSTLNDEQIASVLTYIRQEFGNKSSKIIFQEVAKIRNSAEVKSR